MLKLLTAITIFSYIHSIIKIPFKTIINPIEENLTYIDSLKENNEMIEINIGNPLKKIQLFLKTTYYQFIIPNSKIIKDNVYSNISSSTSSLISKEKKEFYYQSYFGGYLAQDNFMFYNEKGKKITFEKLPFLITDYKNNSPGIIGLNLMKDRNTEDLNFINILFKKKLINSPIWSIKFLNDKEGELIIGDYLHKIYNNEYDGNYLKFTKVELFPYIVNWKIQFDSILYDKEYSIISRYASFILETGLIKAPIEYSKFFLNKLNTSNNCFELNRKSGFFYFYCNKKTNIKLLPNIYFYHRELNFTFILTYEDLFKEINGYYFLLMSFNKFQEFKEWGLGKPFLKKYLFVFIFEKKLIGFYTNYKGKSNIALSYKIIMIFIFIIIGLIWFINQIFKLKKRKVRVNEIEEIFDYTPANQKSLLI